MTVGMTAAIVFSTLSCCCLYDSGLPTPLLLRSRCFLSMALIASATESHEPPLPRKPAPGEELLDEAFGTSLDILFFLPRFGTGIGVISMVGEREDELPLLSFAAAITSSVVADAAALRSCHTRCMWCIVPSSLHPFDRVCCPLVVVLFLSASHLGQTPGGSLLRAFFLAVESGEVGGVY